MCRDNYQVVILVLVFIHIYCGIYCLKFDQGLKFTAKLWVCHKVELLIRVLLSVDKVLVVSFCVPFSWPHSCHTLRTAHYTVTPSARADTRRADWHWVWPLLVSSALLPCPFPALKPSPVCCAEAHSADKQTVLCNRINGAMDWRSLRNLLFAVTWEVLLEGQTKRWWHYSHINICFTMKRKADFGQCLQCCWFKDI